MAAETNGLSRSDLRAELAEQELRLSRLFAPAETVKTLEKRVAANESDLAERAHLFGTIADILSRVGRLEEKSTGLEAVSKYKVWLLTGLGSVILACGTIIVQVLRI